MNVLEITKAFLFLGNFNVWVDEETMTNWQFLILKKSHQTTKRLLSLEDPSCINMILSIYSQSFQSTYVIETGLSNFHRVTFSVLKMHSRKLSLKMISYRDFRKFENEKFMYSLNFKVDCLRFIALNNQNIDYTKNSHLLFEICHNNLNHQAPRNKRYIRGNNKPFMTEALSKSIIKKMWFRNKFLKNPTDENRLAFISHNKKEYY